MKAVCSIFFHNYYGNHHQWMDFFINNISFPANLYYSITESSIYNTSAADKDFYCNYRSGANKNLQQIIARQSSNKGKDIGGKLVLLDTVQKLGGDTGYGLFLHDKKSLQKANNETWADNLLKIADPSFSEKALRIFAGNPAIGIITAAGNLADEYNHTTRSFGSTNQSMLPELQSMFGIYPASYQYVTGTMFWFRMKPLNDFFAKYPPLGIRQMLETGNVTDERGGSYTHCWERLLCWIITSRNYSIKLV